MNAVGIDVSKGKSTVAIYQPGDQVILKPRDFHHTQSGISSLIDIIKKLDGETKVCMEHTGRYYEPVASWLSNAGIFVSAVNPILIKEFGDDSLRAPKTDKADAKKIARYTLDRWTKLKQYSHMDETRNQLKTMNRQFGFYMDQKTAVKNNLIALLDQTYPGANTFFDSPARSDGSQKWVDFVYTYWHVDCVRGKSLEAFTEHYKNWCKRKGYNFSAAKAEELYHDSADLIAVYPKDANTKMLIHQAADIEAAQIKLQENLKYKSILFTNSDELVTVVFSILEQILACDLSTFVDEKKEDFLIVFPEVTFIGEIKGVSTNVKSEYVSQVDVHYHSYLDRLDEEGRTENVKPLLIINPQRNKVLDQREAIHDTQIELAIRNGSLIIDTRTLLTLFERYQKDEIKTETIMSIFSTKRGLLTLSDFSEEDENNQ